MADTLLFMRVPSARSQELGARFNAALPPSQILNAPKFWCQNVGAAN
jgi:hypothetical protein